MLPVRRRPNNPLAYGLQEMVRSNLTAGQMRRAGRWLPTYALNDKIDAKTIKNYSRHIKEKLRVHFNSFMLNVHSRIHELKIKSGRGASSFRDEGSKPFDPIPPVAADITQESWLICFDEFQPLGASDYLVISKTFHTVFISDIPQLSLSRERSQIRRFITLIDTLYDNKVRVVILADTEPKTLFLARDNEDIDDDDRKLMDDLDIQASDTKASIFTGEEEMFACDRCISRIMEMQTEEYWNKWGSTK
ncbi:Putative ATPase N2B [Eumeta japonica]|uniref:ATPase N2B n=1 Tax=Eumeta variegata TaxID=151549 RepID=A0A4C1YBB9_EUMVA|nr:Putative ATPase N2B [Eumeta japonica]